MSKHDKIAKLKEYIKNFVIKELEKDEEIDEASTTASAGAANPMGTGIYYDTPKAFSSGSAVGHKSPEVGGYKKVNESKMKPALKKALKQKGYGPIFQAIDNSKRQLKQLKYSRGEIQDTLIGMFGNEDPKILQKINEGSINESYTRMFIEIGKAINASKADDLNAIRDLGEEYDIGRVLYMARTNPKALKKAVDDRVKEKKQFLTKTKKLKELKEGRYHDWRNDESMTPKQKIGVSVREVRDALNELDKRIKMNLRLKTELNVDSRSYWKNTHKALNKISERLVKLANKVGSMK